MFRLVLSILLVVALSGALAASVMHGVNHGSDHAGHHAEMAQANTLADAKNAIADCCDATGAMGSASCFGDLVNTFGMSLVAASVTTAGLVAHAGVDLSSLTLAVPTGPPKA